MTKTCIYTEGKNGYENQQQPLSCLKWVAQPSSIVFPVGSKSKTENAHGNMVPEKSSYHTRALKLII